MIHTADRLLTDWASAHTDSAHIVLGAPAAEDGPPTVSFSLLDLHSAAPRQRQQPAPVQVELRYLLTVGAHDTEVAHQLLGTLVFAAMQEPRFRVELQPLPSETWAAFGITPRPGFLIRVPVEMERPAEDTPRVRRPVEIQLRPRGSLAGIVLGRDRRPLSSVRVELPGENLVTRTDTRGRFRFAAIPSQPAARELRLRAHGLTQTVTTPPDAEQPMVIHFDPQEI